MRCKNGRDFNNVRPTNAPDERDLMELELRAQIAVMRCGQMRTASRSQGHQRRESGECAGWDGCQALARDDAGQFQKAHTKEHAKVGANNVEMVPALVVTVPKQLGRALIAAMPCPSLLEAQQDP